MLRPLLRARVEQADHDTGDGINSLSFDVFVQVTSATAQRQIAKRRGAAPRFRNNVINFERGATGSFGVSTVLTAVARTTCYRGTRVIRCCYAYASALYSSSQALQALDLEGISFRHQGV